jgi:Kef-type K+ transport system membrane component KefB
VTGIAHAVLFAVLLASSSAALVLPIVAALRLTGRTCLILLFARAALAVTTHVSIMLAGFCFGLVVGAIGEPRRLAKQLFSLTDGLLGPLFFVWLGASLDVRPLRLLPLAALLGVGAVVVHFVVRPSFAGLLSSACPSPPPRWAPQPCGRAP